MDKSAIYKHLIENPDWIDILNEAISLEELKEREWQEKGWGSYIGWEWHDVHASPQVLNKMVIAKLLNVTTSSRSGKTYMVNNRQVIKEVISNIESATEVPTHKEIPQDLFESIVGYDDVKQLVNMAIHSDKPVHILFSGPPASAKTMFLMELNRLPDSYYALAPSLTEAGLSNLIFTYKPKYLIIDEIDRLQWEDIGQLNSLMATGIVSEVKYGKTRTIEISTRVFAAGIDVDRLPRDLLSRFIRIKFKPYTYDEFVKISTAVMVKEGILEDIAKDIAIKTWSIYGNNSDIRQCVYIGRIVRNDRNMVEQIISVIRRYSDIAQLFSYK